MSNFAWVTLTTNDTYSLGALVLAHSLRRAGTAHQLAVMVTPGVSNAMREKLSDVYNVVQEVNVMDSQDAANLALLARPELGITFTKLHCWRLVQFEKCVFLDSDTLVLQNCDELFEREELSAAPDVSWPDCFNSGVFVFKPSLDTFAKITEFALKNGSFDGGDQGLLNQYFEDWATADIKKHLPFVYNVTAYASYCYLPAFKQFRDKIKILHFAGKMKPWLIQFNSENKTASTPSDYAHAADLIQLWWNIFCENVHQKLSDNMSFCAAFVQRLYYEICCNEMSQNYHQYHNFHHQSNQGNDHDHDHDQYQYQHLDIDIEVKEFHDPWEDYYANLHSEKEDHHHSHDIQDHFETNFEHFEESQEHFYEDSHDQCEQIQNQNQNHNHNHNQQSHEHSSYAQRLEEFEQFMQNQYPQSYHQSPEKETIEEPEPTQSYEENYLDNYHEEESQERLYSSEEFHNPDKDEGPEPSSSTESYLHNENSATAIPQDSLDLNRIEHKDESTNEVCIANTKTENENENEKNDQQQPNDDEAGLAGALSQLRLGAQRTPEQEAYEDLMRRQCWESGQIDYSGKDSFENIWKQISLTLDSKAPKQQQQQKQGDDKSGSA